MTYHGFIQNVPTLFLPFLKRSMDDTKRLLPETHASCYGSTVNNCDVDSTRLRTDSHQSPRVTEVTGVTEVTEVKTKLYTRRWYILIIFSLFTALNFQVWNTWGPIAASSEDAFGWNNSMISLLADWGFITFVVGAIFFSWLVERKGLRWAVVLSMGLVTAGCGVRCISSEPPTVTWINNVGAAVNGLATPVAMFCPPVISTTWFGPHERATATALSLVIGGLGLGSSFLLGPYLVPNRINPNCTALLINSSSGDNCVKYFNNSGVRISQERKDIMVMLYIDGALSVLLFLMILIYFPKKPPLPPSVSASQKREDFMTGLKTLFRCRQFWVITFFYGLSTGIFTSWTGLLDVILKPFGLTEIQAGWLGFCGNGGQVFLSLVGARFADKFSRHHKLFIFGMFVITTVSLLLFTLICADILPFSMALLFATFITAGTTLYGSVPLIFELAIEVTYPVAESSSNTVLTLVNNIVGAIFLFIPQIPSFEIKWMNWIVFGALGLCVPSILMLKETYRRLEVDEHTQTKTTQQH